MDSFRDFLHNVLWKLRWVLMKVWNAWKHQVVSHATGLEIDDGLFYFIFLVFLLTSVTFSVRDLTESHSKAFSAVSVSTCVLYSKDSLMYSNSLCRISTRVNLALLLENYLGTDSRMSLLVCHVVPARCLLLENVSFLAGEDDFWAFFMTIA